MTNGAIPSSTGNKIIYSGQRTKVTFSQPKITYPNDSIFESKKLTRTVDKVTFNRQEIEYNPTNEIYINI